MNILAIETSCDETAVAVVENGRTVRSSVVASQIDTHRRYGGVVPEIASRLHCESIVAVCDEALATAECALSEIDAIAVTYGPGLIGALLVGVNFAKGLALAENKLLIPVHHIKGHIAANYIAHPQLAPPYLCMVVSGGHSHIYLVKDYTAFETIGQAIDDAAGEAFDKVARAMGFPYPGGIQIDKASKNGDPQKYKLPMPKTSGTYDFSFSGLKTAVINLLHNAKQKEEVVDIPSLAASFQYTIGKILTDKCIAAAKAYQMHTIALSGGVAANSGLRVMLAARAEQEGIQLLFPPLSLCGDNAAMIGCHGYYAYLAGETADLGLNAVASVPISISRG